MFSKMYFIFTVCFTIVIVVLTLFTLILQTNKFSTLTDIFDIVNLKTSIHKKEQLLFFISLFAFPILNLYLAVNIEVIITQLFPLKLYFSHSYNIFYFLYFLQIFGESILLKKIIHIIKRKKKPKNQYNPITTQPYVVNLLL